MSAVSCAITTASGGCGASHVVVCACRSRTACDVISRLPKRAASASMALASACGSGRFKLLVTVRPKRYLPDDDRGKGYIRGQGIGIEQTGMDNDDYCRRRRCAAPARAISVVGDADRAAMD